MLPNTITLVQADGTTTRIYNRRHDAENKSHYTVVGLSASQERSLTVSHQIQKNKSRRTLIDVTDSLDVPGSTTGATYQDRVYLVIQRGQFTDPSTIKDQLEILLNLAGGDDMDAILDGDV